MAEEMAKLPDSIRATSIKKTMRCSAFAARKKWKLTPHTIGLPSMLIIDSTPHSSQSNEKFAAIQFCLLGLVGIFDWGDSISTNSAPTRRHSRCLQRDTAKVLLRSGPYDITTRGLTRNDNNHCVPDEPCLLQSLEASRPHGSPWNAF